MTGASGWRHRLEVLRTAYSDLALAFYEERERLERAGGPRVCDPGPFEEFRPPMGIIGGVISSLESAVEKGTVPGLEQSFTFVVQTVHERRVLARGAGLTLRPGPHRALWEFIRSASSAGVPRPDGTGA